MGRGGLLFSLPLLVSELWRHQWRHNDVIFRFAKVVVERCGCNPGREPRSVAASNSYVHQNIWRKLATRILPSTTAIILEIQR